MVNENVQETLKAQEQIKETIDALYKHQSEKKNTIIRELNELRKKIHNIEVEVTQNMENLREKMKQNCQKK
jgi:hypothetical protein